MQPTNQNYPNPNPKYNTEGNIGYGLLGFCLPLVGLILFLVWKDEKPADAKYAGIGALISAVIIPIVWLLIFIIGIIASGA